MKTREIIQMDTTDFGYQFLRQSMDRRFGGQVQHRQTDSGPEFKERFKQYVMDLCDRYRVARPYKKNEQAYIESFNRAVKKCLGWIKYCISQLQDCTNLVEEFLDDCPYGKSHMEKNMKPSLTRR